MTRPIVDDVGNLLDESVLIQMSDLAEYSDKEIVFLMHLEQLMITEDTPIISKPKLHDEYINIYNLATVVQSFGGFEQVKLNKQWKNVSRMMGVKQAHVSTFKSLKHSYTRYIEPFLEHIHSVTSKPCCEHFNKPFYASINSFIFNHFTYTEKPPSRSPSPAHSLNQRNIPKTIVLPKRKKNIEKTVAEKRSTKITTTSEEEITSDSNYSSHFKRSTSPEVRKKINTEPSRPLNDQEYHAGDKVYVKYHKVKKLYEATIMDVKNVDKKQKLLVHYYGWNDTYDEWISTNKIVSRVVPPSTQAQTKGKRGRRPKQPQVVTPVPTPAPQKEESSAEQKRKSRSTYNSLQDEYIEAALLNSLKEYRKTSGVPDNSFDKSGYKLSSIEPTLSTVDSNVLTPNSKTSDQHFDSLIFDNNLIMDIHPSDSISSADILDSKKIGKSDPNIKILEEKKYQLTLYIKTAFELCKFQDYKERDVLLGDTIKMLQNIKTNLVENFDFCQEKINSLSKN